MIQKQNSGAEVSIVIAFVVVKCDVENLKGEILSQFQAESFLCIGVSEFGETELSILRQADLIYFVVSETSLCSTAYQSLLFATFPLVKTEKCRLLKLDNTLIPAGFSLLQSLPEARPE